MCCELGLDSGEVSAFGVFLTSECLLMAMSCANMLRTLSGEYDGLEMVGVLCVVVDGLATVGLLCFTVGGSCETGIILVLGCWFAQVG